MKDRYFIYRKADGTNGVIAKFSGGLYYRYDDGKWVENASLIKIDFEITDYEEVSKEEAEKAIGETQRK